VPGGRFEPPTNGLNKTINRSATSGHGILKGLAPSLPVIEERGGEKRPVFECPDCLFAFLKLIKFWGWASFSYCSASRLACALSAWSSSRSPRFLVECATIGN
jgi:hypothetical protein